MTLPVDPAGVRRSRQPRHPATATSSRQAVRWWCRSSSPTDPALPGGSAWEKFYVLGAPSHKGFRRGTSTYLGFLSVVHSLARCHPQKIARCPQESAATVG